MSRAQKTKRVPLKKTHNTVRPTPSLSLSFLEYRKQFITTVKAPKKAAKKEK